MRTWNEISDAVLGKLFMDEDEAISQNYLKRFKSLANECLVFIANAVKPDILPFKFAVGYQKIRGTEFTLVEQNNEFLVRYVTMQGNTITIYPRKDYVFVDTDTDKQYIYDNYMLQELENPVFGIGEPIVMPDNFITFADMKPLCDFADEAPIRYAGRNRLVAKHKGMYVVYYNALYDSISETVPQDAILNIDESVLNCLPTYIAAQLLSEDDIVRSTVLKNEFELMLSRLDTDILYDIRDFNPEGGW